MEDFLKPTYLVFDLETIPDGDLIRKTSDDETAEKYLKGEKFPPFIYHIPITLGILIADGKRVYLYKVYHFKKPKPHELVGIFFKNLRRAQLLCGKNSSGLRERNGNLLSFPILVSHNGSRFDLPVLTAHALKHLEKLDGEAREGLKLFLREKNYEDHRAAKYTKKYTDFAVDLYDYLPTGLKKLAIFFGFKETFEVDGSKVASLYDEGKHGLIAEYCAEDVLITLKVLNRILAAKGLPTVAEPSAPPQVKLFD